MNNTEDNSEHLITSKVIEAVEDAQFLVAHAAKVGLEIDRKTLRTIVDAKYAIHAKNWSPEKEMEFWHAVRRITSKVKPATADSIKATYPDVGISFLSRILGRSRSRRTVNRYIFATLLVLALLLAVQIYWVIGNQLTRTLGDLLQQEKELSLEINNKLVEFKRIEIRFKENTANPDSIQTDDVYVFYSGPEWERETLENISIRGSLESDLEAIKKELRRYIDILNEWSKLWKWMISDDIEAEDEEKYTDAIEGIARKMAEIEDNLKNDKYASQEIQGKRDQIQALEGKLAELAGTGGGDSDQMTTIRSEIVNLTSWVSQPGAADQINRPYKEELMRLEAEKASLERQLERDRSREESRQVLLSAEFALIIMQSYLLPLLYGILGAGAYVLRSVSKEIESVIYSKNSEINYVMRFSMGALAGIVTGWIAFILPGEGVTFLGSVSPLAIAFLIGYNIEIFFTLMDKALERFTKMLEEATPRGSGSP